MSFLTSDLWERKGKKEAALVIWFYSEKAIFSLVLILCPSPPPTRVLRLGHLPDHHSFLQSRNNR